MTPSEDRGALKARAIALLARREHARLELKRKLVRRGADADEVESVLDELEQGQWLSDERYAQACLRHKAPRQGSRRIVEDLRQNGVSEDILATVRDALAATEADRAQAVWQRKFGNLPDDARDYARQYRFLASRGFSAEIIRGVLGTT